MGVGPRHETESSILYDTTSIRQLSIRKLSISQPNNKPLIRQPLIRQPSQLVNKQEDASFRQPTACAACSVQRAAWSVQRAGCSVP